ncbi:winged helix-turn-helix domain-containing protein [Streptomyces kronopolitis]|uniref:winged helix-turn-helix domain-containing protein n=1 Tax=Streptomyces kronopolitis TaxID=1612435 RepID=UPI0035582A72
MDLGRVGRVVAGDGSVPEPASVWRLLTGRLGWSRQRPERRAMEGDESEIANWSRAIRAWGTEGMSLTVCDVRCVAWSWLVVAVGGVGR